MKRSVSKIIEEKGLGISFEEDLTKRLKEPKFRKAWEEPTGDVYLDTAVEIIMARKEKKLTQTQLAQKVGTSQQAIARLENPTYKGRSIRILDKIAQVLGKRLEIRLAS